MSLSVLLLIVLTALVVPSVLFVATMTWPNPPEPITIPIWKSSSNLPNPRKGARPMCRQFYKVWCRGCQLFLLRSWQFQINVIASRLATANGAIVQALAASAIWQAIVICNLPAGAIVQSGSFPLNLGRQLPNDTKKQPPKGQWGGGVWIYMNWYGCVLMYIDLNGFINCVY